MSYAAALLACKDQDSVSRQIPVSPPLKAAELIGEHLVLYPERSSKAEGLVDLRVFGTLRPGMSANQAWSLAGTKSGESLLDEKASFKEAGALGEVEVIYRVSSSPDLQSEYWTLEGRPASKDPAAVFHPAIAAAISAAGKPTLVSIMGADGQGPVAHVQLSAGQVSVIHWLRESSATPERSDEP